MAHVHQVYTEFDVPEPRALRGRLVAASDGTAWDMGVSTNVWLDPVTRTAMLAPLPTLPTWKTTFSGFYARIRKTGYSGLTSAKWKESPRQGSGDYYLVSESGVNETATTTTVWPVNQPFYLSLYVPGTENLTNQTFLECGWGAVGSPGSVWLRFRVDGRVTVYVGSDPVGHYEWQGGALGTADAQRSGPPSREGTNVNIMLIPCRWNRLLVIANGAGFEHEFGGIPFAPGPQPTITPNAAFWWHVPPAAGQACVQLAPLRFAASGTLYSRPITLRYAPPGGSVFLSRFFGDLIGSSSAWTVAPGLANVGDGLAFVPDGITDAVRVAVALSGDQTNSPGIYAADCVLPPVGTTTADATTDVTCLMQELEFSVPENGPTRVSLLSRKLEALDTAGIEQVQVTGDRPFRIRVGAIDLIRGTLSAPELVLGGGEPTTWAEHAKWEGMDREAELNYSTFADALPYDNALLADAYRTLWQDVGVSSGDVVVTADGFRLPYSPACSLGEWILLQQRGDTRGQWKDKLRSDFAPTWVCGWVPTTAGYKNYMVDPAALTTVPIMQLFEGAALARAYGLDEDDLPYRSISQPVIERIPAEANQILVIGYDPRRRRDIVSQWDDAASQNPTLTPALRPSNWRGRLHTVTYISPLVQSQAIADRIRDLLASRLGVVQEIATWTGELLIDDATNRPLWKGDVVRLARDVTAPGVALARGDYRIFEIPRGRLLKNVLNQRPIWRVTYRARKLGVA
jgi:hypothetical protein